jgi:hypothetical protein
MTAARQEAVHLKAMSLISKVPAAERRRISDDVWSIVVTDEYLALMLHNDASN